MTDSFIRVAAATPTIRVADPARNAAHGPLISTEASRLRAYVIPTNEEWMMAHHAQTLLAL